MELGEDVVKRAATHTQQMRPKDPRMGEKKPLNFDLGLRGSFDEKSDEKKKEHI